ncbi:hypothetical protein GCM10009759_78670 [Kitasatospora saccharophila]|uniref:Uncharacterized protein n=1 Tax=Kitasatospora saccharophila TaxID=407973 RepID=A0ABP5K3E4_9ACTN
MNQAGTSWHPLRAGWCPAAGGFTDGWPLGDVGSVSIITTCGGRTVFYALSPYLCTGGID